MRNEVIGKMIRLLDGKDTCKVPLNFCTSRELKFCRDPLAAVANQSDSSVTSSTRIIIPKARSNINAAGQVLMLRSKGNCSNVRLSIT